MPDNKQTKATGENIEDIVKNLQAEGKEESIGFFTLDREKAKEKMKRFRLENPYFYVMEFIACAVSSGAKTINIYNDSDDLIIKFDGTPFTAKELEDLYSYLFYSQTETEFARLIHLAIGINSSTSMKPAFILIKSGTNTEAVELYINGTTGSETLKKADKPADCTTFIHVKDRLCLRTISNFISKSIDIPAETKVIKKYCALSPVPIIINNKEINFKTNFSNLFISENINEADFNGTLGLPKMLRGNAKLIFVQNGISYTKEILGYFPANFEAIIYTKTLSLNISRSNIVENDEYKKIMSLLRDYSEKLIERLISLYLEEQEKTKNKDSAWLIWVVQKYLFNIISQLITLETYTPKCRKPRKELTTLMLFNTSKTVKISLKDMMEQYKELGIVPYADPMKISQSIVFPGVSEKNLHHLLLPKTQDESQFLILFFKEKLIDFSLQLNQNSIKYGPMATITHVSSHKAEIEIPDSIKFNNKGISGIIVFRDDIKENLIIIDFYKRQKLITRRKYEFMGLCFYSSVDSANFSIDINTNLINENNAYYNAILTIFENLPKLFIDNLLSEKSNIRLTENAINYALYLYKRNEIISKEVTPVTIQKDDDDSTSEDLSEIIENMIISVSKTKIINTKNQNSLPEISIIPASATATTSEFSPKELEFLNIFKKTYLFLTIENYKVIMSEILTQNGINYIDISFLQEITKKKPKNAEYIEPQDTASALGSINPDCLILNLKEIELLKFFFPQANITNLKGQFEDIIKNIKSQKRPSTFDETTKTTDIPPTSLKIPIITPKSKVENITPPQSPKSDDELLKEKTITKNKSVILEKFIQSKNPRVFISIEVKDEDLEGSLYLPELYSEEAEIFLMLNDEPVCKKKIPKDLPCGGFLKSKHFKVNEMWTDITMPEKINGEIALSVRDIYDKLIENFNNYKDIKEKYLTAKYYLMDFLKFFKERLLSFEAKTMSDTLKKAGNIEIFETFNGEFISIFKIIDNYKKNKKILYTEEKHPDAINTMKMPVLYKKRHMMQTRCLEYIFPETAFELFIPPQEQIRVSSTLQIEKKFEISFTKKSTKTEVKEIIVKTEQKETPKKVLVVESEKIKTPQCKLSEEELLFLQDIKKQLTLAEKYLDKSIIDNIQFKTSEGSELFDFSKENNLLLINKNNKYFKMFLQMWQKDHSNLLYLISSIFSFLNVTYIEIDSDDEIQFNIELIKAGKQSN